MSLKKNVTLCIIFFVSIACSNSNHNDTNITKKQQKYINKKDIPDKIKLLFVTQPHCPSCDELERTMKQNRPAKLIKNYFSIQKINIGQKLPDGLIKPNGTPTIYFLGYKDEVLVEPMIGEKNETTLMMFLNDALYEYKNLYGIDLEQKGDNNETNSSNNNSNNNSNTNSM